MRTCCFAAGLTQLLRPSDGGARVRCVPLRQVNHLRADLPSHQRIKTYGGGESVKEQICRRLESVAPHLRLKCVACSRC